mgnify:CR=1
MQFYFNPLDKACKSRTGAFPRGCSVTFRLYWVGTEAMPQHLDARFVYWQDGKERTPLSMHRTDDGFYVTLCFHQIGLYFYYFRIGDEYFGCGRLRNGEFMPQVSLACWQITVFDEAYHTPAWMKGGVMYQIFPDRFYRAEGDYPVRSGKILREDWGGLPSYRPNSSGKVLNNDFFGGNLNGVTEKLDYLQSLGVTVLYFNPIFEAYSNHRYDTGDYLKIDPLLGTDADLDRLVAEAEKRGIRIILDAVLNHTGSDSRYFNKYGTYDSLGAYQSQDSPYADWYRFSHFPDQYDSWWGIDTLPAVNENSSSYQEFVFGENGVLHHWLRRGIGGYRLDVADELPDFFLEKLRCVVKEASADAVIIGEVWEDASNKIAYSERRKYLQGGELDSVMNYPLKDAIIGFVKSGKTSQLRETLFMLMDNYPKETLDCLMNILGTHDTARILTVFGGKECSDKDEMATTFLSESEKAAAKRKVMMAAVLQFTLPGVPCIYYGDENAMEGHRDPFCRRCFDWLHTDEELLAFYRKLGALRQKFGVFSEGEYGEVYADSSCLLYERRNSQEVVYIWVNNSYCEYSIHVKGTFQEHLTDAVFSDRIECGPKSCGIFTKIK